MSVAILYSTARTEEGSVGLHASDAVSSTTTEGRRQITTFTRDGLLILRVMQPISQGNDSPISQEVLLGEQRVATVMKDRGEFAIMVRQGAPATVIISPTAISVTSDAGVLEMFDVNEGILSPVSGEILTTNRRGSRAIGETLDQFRRQ